MTEFNQLITENEKTLNNESSKKNSTFIGILTFFLLLAPLILGMHINTLGNAVPIRAKIAIQLNLNKNQLVDLNKIADLFPISYWSLGALYPIGGMVGALTSSLFADKYGRKKSTYIFLFSNIVGSCLKVSSIFSHFSLLFIGRFFDGIGSAGIMVTVVILMFELQTKFQLKFSKPLVQITINLGILIFSVLSLNEVFGINFIHLYYIPALISIIIFIIFQFLPESPVYLLNIKKDKKACISVLKKIHGNNFQLYFNELVEQYDNNNTKKINIIECFKNKRFRGALISVVLLNAAQQLSGINAIMSFTPTILRNMNISNEQLFSISIIGSAFIGSIIFAPLVSKWKRKTSLLIGHTIMAICLIGQLITFYNKGPNELQLFFLSFFVFIFQIGPGPLLWFICIEIFTNDVVTVAQSIGVSSNWISNSLVFAIAAIDMSVLGFFAIINVLICFFMIFFVSETLGKNPNQILDNYEKRYQKCC